MSINDEKFDPFRRADLYGDMGRGKLPPLEYLRLAIFGITLFPFRVFLLCSFILWFYLVCQFSQTIFSGPQKRQFVAKVGKFACGIMLYCIGITEVKWVKIDEQKKNQTDKNNQIDRDGKYAAIVCNHVGWPDIFVLFARYFPSFVARAGTESIPIVGFICDVMGCLYIKRERSDKSQPGMAQKLKLQMQTCYDNPEQHYNPVLIFPEGTTTNNKYLLPFKSGVFLAGLPLQLVVLKYEVQRVSAAWESIGALRHVFLMFCNPSNKVTCYELPIYYPTEQEKQDARLYASNVRKCMLDVGQFISSDSTLEEKREYHALLRAQLDKQQLDKKQT